MAAASKLKRMGVAERVTRRVITVTLSGSYAAGGQAIDLTALTNPLGLDGAKQFMEVPIAGDVEILNFPFAYQATWVVGTTLANGKLKIWDESAAAEFATGAYAAGLTGADSITIAVNTTTGK